MSPTNLFFINYLLFILFLVALGLCFCVLAFSSCGEWGLLSSSGVQASHCGGFSCCKHGLQAHRLQQFQLMGSRVWAQQLGCTGLVAPRYVGSSSTRDGNCVPCIGRLICNHWNTSKVPGQLIYDKRNQEYTLGKGQSLQEMVLRKLDNHV